MDCPGCLLPSGLGDAGMQLGLSRRAVDRLIARGTLVRADRTTVIGACLMSRAASDPRFAHELLVRRLLRRFPEAVASHGSAALLLGLPLLRMPTYCVATREFGAWRGGPMRIRIAPLPQSHLADIDGLRCTNIARSVMDVARTLPFRDAVVLGDAAMRVGESRPGLRAMLGECAAWADVGKAASALAFFDGRAESALESVSRAIMYERRVPPPDLQVSVESAPGIRYRLDFFWREQRVVGEADGLNKYDTPEVLRAEKLRQERLEQMGLKVVRWTWNEMVHDTDTTITRLVGALRR